METGAHFQTIFKRQDWAMERLFRQLMKSTETELGVESFAGARSPLETLRHMVQAESMWLAGITETGNDGRSAVPTESVADIQAYRAGVSERFERYLANLPEGELERQFGMTFPNGMAVRPPVYQALLQLAMHSAQHRSALTLMVTGLGHSPRELDFLFPWRRTLAFEEPASS